MAGARENIRAGGDSGSRAILLGAISGARLGTKYLLPIDWAEKTTAFPQVQKLVSALVAQRAPSSPI